MEGVLSEIIVAIPILLLSEPSMAGLLAMVSYFSFTIAVDIVDSLR